LRRLPLSGLKVSRFAENLKGNMDVVTIDTWICQAYGVAHKGLTPSVYARLETRLRREARARGLRPASWQAIVWYAMRRESGIRYRSFMQVVREFACETPYLPFSEC
jgi:hypothetical protein